MSDNRSKGSRLALKLAAPIRLVGLRPRYAIDDGTAVFAQLLLFRQRRIPATYTAFVLQQLPEAAVLAAFDRFAHVAHSSRYWPILRSLHLGHWGS